MLTPPPSSAPVPTTHADSVSYRYSRTTPEVLSNVSIVLKPREIHGLVGHNGAGKTTLILLLAGVLSPASGIVTIGDTRAHVLDIQRGVGLVTDKLRLYGRFTVLDTCEVFARMLGIKGRAETTDRVVEEFGLQLHRHHAVDALSSGLRKRLTIAIATMHQPGIVLLDEPFAGLDPESVRLLSGRILAWREEGRAVLVSTHDLPELEEIASVISVMREGRILASESMAGLRELIGGSVRHVSVETRRGEHTVALDAADLASCFAGLADSGIEVTGVKTVGGSLAELYAALHQATTQ